MSALHGGDEDVGQVPGADLLLGQCDDDLALLLEKRARVDDREAHDRPVRAVADVVPFDRAVEVHGRARLRTPRFDPEDVPDEHWVEDVLTIERVEPGALWFEEGIGPVRVSKEASELAQPGWSVNIVLAQLRGEWRIVELGFVYP